MLNAVKEIYDNRENFIILGLTGKIGTGTTTAAKFLSSPIKDHSLNPIELHDQSTDAQRKRYIVHKFYSQNWHPFISLAASDAMTFLLFEQSFKAFKNLLKEVYADQIINEYFEEDDDAQSNLTEVKYLFAELYQYQKLNNDKKVESTKSKLLKIYSNEKKFTKDWTELFNTLKRKKLKDYIQLPQTFKTDFKKFRKQQKEYLEIGDDFSAHSLNLEELSKAYEYITKILPQNAHSIKTKLKELSQREYTKIYQKLGDNLRKYGQAGTRENEAKNIYKISSTLNRFIKVIRRFHRNDNVSKKTYVVIDSLRNPMEAVFFKERYSAFYLLSVNSTDSDIFSRLATNHNLSKGAIEEQSKKENPADFLDNYNHFTSQNIRDCIQKADIHISNPGGASNNHLNEFYGQLIKFVSLIQHPGLVTPSNHEKMMQIAYTAKLNSGCLSRQVGAAVTNSSGSLVSIGWNSVAEGQTPCLLRNKQEVLTFSKSQSYSEFEKSDDFIKMLSTHTSNYQNIPPELGRNQSFCFKSIYNKNQKDKNQVHTRSLHAEENAFLQIAKHGGEPVMNGTLYTTASPCELCSKKAYQLGIKKIIYIDPYPGIAKRQILNSGAARPEMILFSGAIGSAYHKVYDQILPFKDELDAISSDSCCS